MSASSPHNTAIQAAHVARVTLETLTGRPLSHANAPFVRTCLEGLRRLAARLDEVCGRLDAPHRPAARAAARRLRDVAAAPTSRDLEEAGRVLRDDFRLYASFMRAPLADGAAPADPFRASTPRAAVVVTGPGIGIGDETKLEALLARLQRHFALEDAAVELFSYCPGIWRALRPAWTVRDLGRDPLAAYDRLHEMRREPRTQSFVAFANFLRRDALRTMLPYAAWHDVVDISVGAGEARVMRRGRHEALRVDGLDAAHPCLSRSLTRLADALFPRGSCAPAPRSQPRAPNRAAGGGPFRILVSPFTSKPSPLRAEDWAEFVAAMVRSLAPRRPVACEVLPGLTDECRAHAADISRMIGHHAGGRAVSRLAAQDEAGFTADNAVERVFESLQRTDLIFGIDTFTAHLAARTAAVSVALSLEQNPRFWDPSPRTFWFNIQTGRDCVLAASRAVARLLDARGVRAPPLLGFVDAGRRLGAALPCPPGGAHGLLDEAWHTLPRVVRDALERIDGDMAWPTLSRAVRGGDPAGLRLLPRSNFARLLALAEPLSWQGHEPAAA